MFRGLNLQLSTSFDLLTVKSIRADVVPSAIAPSRHTPKRNRFGGPVGGSSMENKLLKLS